MLLEEEDPQDHGIFFILITRGRSTRKRRLTMGRGCGWRRVWEVSGLHICLVFCSVDGVVMIQPECIVPNKSVV